MIKENVRRILAELPKGVELVAAAKGRKPEEILDAVEAGIKIVGENYVQEAEAAYEIIGNKASWHYIGHLQKNKVRKAVQIFDMIETVDSLEIAAEIDKRCRPLNKIMPILVEINSGHEPQKSGIFPENALDFIARISQFNNLRVCGLMTMGPNLENPEDYLPYFKETSNLFEKLKESKLSNVEMKFLSMGMSVSYKAALDCGANLVRLGTKIFGERKY